jgi:hypothetical protein
MGQGETHVRFFVGLHHPSAAQHFDAAFISVNTLRRRKGPFTVGDWIMDSGAFTEVAINGGYRFDVEEYAGQIRRWARNGNMLRAVAQDFMCEPWVIERTGLTMAEHQRLTIERYDALVALDTGGIEIMPVLQGQWPADYVSHIEQYGARLTQGMWVGVGSVCKRKDARSIEDVLEAIRSVRPDLRLHGFGLKLSALASGRVRLMLYSADSMAWSFSARKQGRNGNDWKEAKAWVTKIETQAVQWPLFL